MTRCRNEICVLAGEGRENAHKTCTGLASSLPGIGGGGWVIVGKRRDRRGFQGCGLVGRYGLWLVVWMYWLRNVRRVSHKVSRERRGYHCPERSKCAWCERFMANRERSSGLDGRQTHCDVSMGVFKLNYMMRHLRSCCSKPVFPIG